MKKLFLLLIFAISISTYAVAQTAQELYETAKTYMRNGDYDNALLVIKKAIEKEPENFEMLKDECFLYYLKRDFGPAVEKGKVLVEKPQADEQSFQILGMTYKAIAEYKECRKLYKKALVKFPNSGVIYNEAGELFAMDNDLDNAIIMWESGMAKDANYSSNYYNAVKHYAGDKNPDLFWIIFQGENFVNLESYTARTTEIKKIILEAYKKLYLNSDLLSAYNDKKISSFEKDALTILNKTTSIASDGITAENIMAIKTRFVLDWQEKYATKYPCRLFEHFQHMLKEGIFDAYNQWLCGSVANSYAYDAWLKAHSKEAEAFKKFQTARIYKIPAGQYYK